MDELNLKFLPFPLAARQLTKVSRGFLARRRVRALLDNKEKVIKAVESLITHAERMGAGTRTVMIAVSDEDNARPADFWVKPKAKPDTKATKEAKEAEKKKNLARTQSVKWFKEVELKKGAGVASNGKFEEWFHGGKSVGRWGEARELLEEVIEFNPLFLFNIYCLQSLRASSRRICSGPKILALSWSACPRVVLVTRCRISKL